MRKGGCALRARLPLRREAGALRALTAGLLARYARLHQGAAQRAGLGTREAGSRAGSRAESRAESCAKSREDIT